MEFHFITEAASLTELDVLVMIYNLLLMMSIFCVCIVGFKLTYMFLRKGLNFKK